ncbi:hypothetical protein AMK16_28010 [Streptomyces sp. CB00455]|nr:hypothetical protein AMK16_28010 [Streptomyces sp. CB00455]
MSRTRHDTAGGAPAPASGCHPAPAPASRRPAPAPASRRRPLRGAGTGSAPADGPCRDRRVSTAHRDHTTRDHTTVEEIRP